MAGETSDEARPAALPPAVTVHWLEHAGTALDVAAALGRPVALLSAPGAAFTVGPLYFLEMIRAARASRPSAEAIALYDCADAPGRVLEALDAGLAQAVAGFVYEGPEAPLAALRALAAARGAFLLTRRPDSLDLLDLERPEEDCRAWLGGQATRGGARR